MASLGESSGYTPTPVSHSCSLAARVVWCGQGSRRGTPPYSVRLPRPRMLVDSCLQGSCVGPLALAFSRERDFQKSSGLPQSFPFEADSGGLGSLTCLDASGRSEMCLRLHLVYSRRICDARTLRTNEDRRRVRTRFSQLARMFRRQHPTNGVAGQDSRKILAIMFRRLHSTNDVTGQDSRNQSCDSVPTSSHIRKSTYHDS